ncbi:MAG: BamA/TamA family outer membrane protein [Planctomycetota bacterium]
MLRFLCLFLLLLSPAFTAGQEKERPAPQLAFEGNQVLDGDALRGALQFEIDAWREGLPPAVVADDARYQIEQEYQRRGYLEVQVTVEQRSESAKDPAGLHFQIVEGPLHCIAQWEFPGAIDSEGLKKTDLIAMYGAVDSPVRPRDVDRLPGRIAERYRSQGYLDVDVSDAKLDEVKTACSRLTIRIEPGPRYTLGGIEHNVAPELAAEAKLDAALAEVQGGTGEAPIFQPVWVPRWQRAAQSSLGDLGYLDVQVVSQTRQENGQVFVTLDVTPGERSVLGAIHIPPDLKVADRFVLEKLGLTPGEPLTPDGLDNAVVRLYRTGRFETVRLNLAESGATRDLTLEIKENPQREAFIEPGYGSFEGARLHMGWRHYNIGGYARTLGLEGVVAERAERLLVTFSDPWTIGHDWVLNANSDYSVRKRPAYTHKSWSMGVFASRNFGHRLRWNTDVGLRYQRVGVSDVRVDLLDGLTLPDEFEQDLSSTTLEWGIEYDSRNHPLLPTDGRHIRFALQRTLDNTGSAPPYTRLQTSYTYFYPLGDRQTLAMGLRATAILPDGNSDLPLGLRLFSGGENSVRSFREDELGPVDDDGTPIGGVGSSTLSIEYLSDIGDTNWQWALFTDVGNVVESPSDLLRGADLETAVGAGVRYILPIGPIRADYAHNPNATEEQSDWVLHISVGMAF